MTEIFRFLKPYVKKSRWKFVWAFIFLMSGLLSFALMPEILKDLLNGLCGQGDVRISLFKGGQGLKWGVFLGAVCAAVHFVCQYLSGVFLARGAEQAVCALRCRIYNHMVQVEGAFLDAQDAGDIIARCTSDVEVIRKFISTEMLKVLRMSLQILFSAVLMCRISLRVSLSPVIAIPVILSGSYLYYRKVAICFLQADEAEAQLLTRAEENITGVMAVRAYGLEDREVGRFEKANEAYLKLWRQIGRFHSYYFAASNLCVGVEVLAVLLLGCVEAKAGRLTFGDYMAVFAYNGTLIWPVRELGRTLATMGQAEVSAKRIQDLLEAPVEADQGKERPDLLGDIEFRNVTFSYDGKNNILENFSCRIPGGKKTALLGKTGSGKSTVLLLLMKFYTPDRGEILIDGVNIKDVSNRYLRENIGCVLQEPYLYAGTLEDNLSMAGEKRGFQKACEMACIYDSIKAMPKGYKTPVGEKGDTLSGGQRQRVAMAQVFLKNAPILLLDDALSAVDAETDRKIRKAMRTHCQGKTLVLITHRKTLSGADTVIRMDKGCAQSLEENRKEGV